MLSLLLRTPLRLPAVSACVVVVLMAAGCGTARAATYTWTGGAATDNWTNNGNWLGNIAPTNDGAADILYPATASAAATLDAGYSVHSFSFLLDAPAYTLSASNSATLTLGSGGLNQNSPNLQVLNAPVVLGTTTQSWYVGSGGLTLNNGVTGSAQYLTLVKNGTGTLTLTGTASNLAGFDAELDVDGGKLTLSSNLTLTLFYLGNNAGSGAVEQTGGSATMESLALGAGAGLSGSYTLSGGTLSTGQTVFGFYGQGTFTQTGGTHTPSSLTIGYYSGSSGSYTLSGGTLSANSETVGGTAGAFVQNGITSTNTTSELFIGSSPSTTCTYTLDDGALTVSALEVIGYNGAAILQQNGGTHVVQELYLGSSGGGYPTAPYTSVYQLSGGSLTVQEDETIGDYSPGTFIQTGGAHQVDLDVVLGAYSGSDGSSLNVSGGSLAVKRSLSIGYNGQAAMTVSGTGAVAITSSLSLLNYSASNHLTITGGGTVTAGDLSSAAPGTASPGISLSDPPGGGVALTVGTDNTASTFNGSIVDAANGPGSLKKVGTGTLTLEGTDSYTGSTLVSGGTLSVGGSFKGSNTVQVSSGATFQVSAGGSVSIGQLTNAGRLRLIGSATLNASGQIINHGTLDVISWQGTLPNNFVNAADGTVLNTSNVQLTSITHGSTTDTVTFQAYAGHMYVLQNSPSLSPASWSSGSSNPSINPSADGPVALTAYLSGKTAQRFYRVVIDP